jgi:hypothetical protein
MLLLGSENNDRTEAKLDALVRLWSGGEVAAII